MTRKAVLTIVLMAGLASAALADTNKAMVEAGKKSQGAFVMITCRIQNQMIMGQAVCVDPAGVFMTFALPGRIQPDMFKEVQIVPPGLEPTPVNASVLGIDPEAGIAFIKAEGTAKWPAIQFAPAAKVQLGQQVVSAGIMPGDPGMGVALGTGYVAAEMRVPGKLYFVSGGALTSVGSVVFNDAGEAIGIVGPQPYKGFQMLTERGPTDISLRPRQESEFFSPIDEYAHIIATRGQRKLPWIGVLDFTAEPKDAARPVGIKLGRVLKDQLGAKAGLEDGDLVVKVDDRPIQWLGNPVLTTQNFIKELLSLEAGKTITLTILREKAGKTETVTKPVVLEAMPKLPQQAAAYGSGELGMIVREKVMLDSYTLQGKAAQPGGLVVETVYNNTLAAVAGLLPGDVIYMINGEAVSRADTFKAKIEQAILSPTKPIVFMIYRGDESLPLTIQPPRVVQPAPATTAPAAERR